jgi:6-pyruvoyl-tetrahydropterin synthase
MEWDVSLRIDMEESGEDNMPVDLKAVSDTIDQVDHALLLNEDDPIVDEFLEWLPHDSKKNAKNVAESALGDVIWFDSDPTCELVSKWMAKQIYELSDAIGDVHVSVSETEKYAISATYNGMDEKEDE